MDTCIVIIMYCQRLFLLFTGKQHCLRNFFSGDLPATDICLHAKFKIGGITILAVQISSTNYAEEGEEEEEVKQLEKTCFAVFPRCYVKYIYFW